jgi:hypothetical protein
MTNGELPEIDYGPRNYDAAETMSNTNGDNN